MTAAIIAVGTLTAATILLVIYLANEVKITLADFEQKYNTLQSQVIDLRTKLVCLTADLAKLSEAASNQQNGLDSLDAFRRSTIKTLSDHAKDIKKLKAQ